MHLKIDIFFTKHSNYLAIKIDKGKPSLSLISDNTSLSFRLIINLKSTFIKRERQHLISKLTQTQEHVVRQ